jgi:Flp pilus assembly protein TadG
MIRRHPLARGRSVLRDRTAMAMIEFALLAPIMCTLLLGSYEAANLILADLKLESAAETACDLLGQFKMNQSALPASEFTDYTNAVKQIMAPLPTSGTQLKAAYASITYSTGTAVIDWHTEVNGASPISLASLPNGASANNLGHATSGSTDSIVVVQLTYAYSSSLSYLLNSAYTLTEAALNRPRYVNCVPTYLNAGNPPACP